MMINRLLLAVLLSIGSTATVAQVPHEANAASASAPAVGATGSPPPVAPPGGSGTMPMVKPASARQPVFCRSTPVVGSLIAQHKRCLTKAQWRYVDDANETEARRLMLENTSRPNCDAHC